MSQVLKILSSDAIVNARNILRRVAPSDVDVDKIEEIKIASPEVQKEKNEKVLSLSVEDYKQVVDQLQSSEHVSEIINTDAVTNANEILERARGRKTGMTSWLLQWLASSEDSEEAVKNHLINTSRRLKKSFVEWFPPLFSVQHILVPILARRFKQGPLAKIFDFMRIINPWIGEFAAEPLGLYKTEINNIRRGNGPKETDVESVQLLDLTQEQYDLQQIIKKISEALDRLLGKRTSLSSWIMNGVLKFSGHRGSFNDFAKQFESPTFIKQFHEHLKNGSGLNDKKDTFVSGIIKKLVSVANSTNDNFIKKAPVYFGSVYSFQYLLMPIVTKFVKEDSLIGKLLGVVRDVNPIINDLIFDPLATFQEEITNVRTILASDKSVNKLFPPLALPDGVTSKIDFIAKHMKSLYQGIYDFSRKRFGLSES